MIIINIKIQKTIKVKPFKPREYIFKRGSQPLHKRVLSSLVKIVLAELVAIFTAVFF